MTKAEQSALMRECHAVFSPSAPIDSKNLFAGRRSQIAKVENAIRMRGRHAIIFGERGVGKTSLANILKNGLEDGRGVVRVTCANDDTFPRVWRRALAEIDVPVSYSTMGIHSQEEQGNDPAASLLPDDFGSGDIVQLFRKTLLPNGAVFIFDEFDRLASMAKQFSDVIKGFSDNSVDSTIILIGVAGNVNELIVEHGSIDRAVVQIPMPRMSEPELSEIIQNAVEGIGIKVEDNARELIVLLSQGLPHYTHLIGLESAIASIGDRRKIVSFNDVRAGVKTAIESTQQTVRSTYLDAVRSPRKDARFRLILLAAALTPVDELGYFSTVDTRAVLKELTGKNFEIRDFMPHIDKFSGDGHRGGILDRTGSRRLWNFRFKNPMLQSFIVMKGLADDMLGGDLLNMLRQRTESFSNSETS